MGRSIIPLAAMEKLLKKAGAARVSEDAKMALKDVLENIGLKIGGKSLTFAKHSGRKTVKAVDIKLAEREN